MIGAASLPFIFARGGGGGSGGGGGGDGGFGIAAIGYIPMHLLGAFFRRSKDNKALFGTLQAVGWFITVPFAIVLTYLLGGIGFVAGIGGFVGMGAGLYGWFGKLKTNKFAESQLKHAAATDSAWDQNALLTYASQVFERFQYDWSRGDVDSMKNYLTPWYHYHVSLMMLALKEAQRTNQMSDVKVIKSNVQRVQNAANNSQDQVTIGFQAKATDQLIDSRDGRVLFTDKNEFVEYWNFNRHGNTWLLGGIDQSTANYLMANTTIQQFAHSQQFCYSLDWGWLLLPQRGQLFGRTGKFGKSDINNHVIGLHNNQLVQMYTYTPVAGANNAKTTDQYLVAQMQLPKSYGDILVRRKKGLMSKEWFKVKGLDKISMEWPDFNKKYEVFASTGEGPTSCELVHPVFMETLEAAPFEVNLEVADNMVYFYTKETALHPDHYPAMLGILQEAFKQMKM